LVVTTVKLTRFMFPVVQFVRTKAIAGVTIDYTLSVFDGSNTIGLANADCAVNSTNSMM